MGSITRGLSNNITTGGVILPAGITNASVSAVTSFANASGQPATDDVGFEFNGSTDSGSNYNVTKTTTNFTANHLEDDSFTTLAYQTTQDLAQSTAFQKLSHHQLGNGNDESFAGTLTVFNPSSTTYVKHFIASGSTYYSGDGELNTYVAGYFNTTSAINAIRFQMSSGNIDDGIIKLYGVKKS